MAYYPLVPSTDSRASKGMVPLNVRNAFVEKQPAGANKASTYLLRPTPGRRLLTTLPANVRGLFCEPGCQNGQLFAAAGSTLYSISTAWTAAGIGSLAGGDPVTIRSQRAKALVRAYGVLYLLDNSLTTVSDADAPAFAMTLASVGTRGIAAELGGDSFKWSKAGDFLDWDPSAQAADFDLPDPIVGQEEYNSDLWNGNSRSTQIWRPDPTAPDESESFAPLSGVNIPVGWVGRGAVAKLKGGLHFVGVDSQGGRAFYAGAGLGVTPIPNRDFEEAIKSIPAQDLAGTLCWSYADGTKEFVGARTTLERAFVLDKDSGLWHERTRYGEAQFDIGFVTAAYETIVAASPDSAELWALDPEAYTDAGTPIERIMSVKVPAGGGTSIDKIVIDGRWFDQPLSGQGSAPQLMLDYSTDGGQTWGSQYGDIRVVELPGLGESFRVQDFGFGMVDGQNGLLLRLILTDPIGFAISGIFVNPGEEELSGRG